MVHKWNDNLGDIGFVTIPCYGIAFPAHPNWCYTEHTISLNRKNDRAVCVARVLVQCLDGLCETITRKKKSQDKLRFRWHREPTTVDPSLSIFTAKAVVEIPYRIVSPCCTIQTGRSNLKYLLCKRRSKCRCCCLVPNLLLRSYFFSFFALGCISKHAMAGWTCSIFRRITRCSSSSVPVRIFADGKNRRQRQGWWWPAR